MSLFERFFGGNDNEGHEEHVPAWIDSLDAKLSEEFRNKSIELADPEIISRLTQKVGEYEARMKEATGGEIFSSLKELLEKKGQKALSRYLDSKYKFLIASQLLKKGKVSYGEILDQLKGEDKYIRTIDLSNAWDVIRLYASGRSEYARGGTGLPEVPTESK